MEFGDLREVEWTDINRSSLIHNLELFRETGISVDRSPTRSVGVSLPDIGVVSFVSRIANIDGTNEHEFPELKREAIPGRGMLAGQMHHVAGDLMAGYGCASTAPRLSQLPMIPVGYANSYSRSLGSHGRVLIRGRSVSDVGRVGKKNHMAEATNILDESIGDEAALVYRQADDEISVEKLIWLNATSSDPSLAGLAPTISREAA